MTLPVGAAVSACPTRLSNITMLIVILRADTTRITTALSENVPSDFVSGLRTLCWTLLVLAVMERGAALDGEETGQACLTLVRSD
eukprot:3157095-Rhodomonas_salina.1